MKLKLLWDKSLPEPEVTVASAPPEDDEATRILEALQSAAGSTCAYVEKAGTSKERVPFARICSLEASDEGAILHTRDGRTLFAAQRLSAPSRCSRKACAASICAGF